MKNPLISGVIIRPLHPAAYAPVKRHKIKSLGKLATLAILGLALLAATQPASAVSDLSDPVVSALRDYAQTISVDAAGPVAADPSASVVPDLRGHVRVAASKPVKAVIKAAPTGEATYIGAQVCMTCHATQAAEFNGTLMGRINRTTRKGSMDCENCHGPGSAHVAAGGGRGVGGIISFRPDDDSRSVKDNNKICLGCHEKGGRNYWRASTHENRGLACTNCHTVMKSVTAKFQLMKQTEMETCFQCHQDRRAQLFRSSHMPMREGKVTCSNCHNPHGSATDAMLREKSINDNCYKCHAEKRGPFLFEHAPVRENCLACHDAHGSVNEYLLNVSRQRLCGECHGMGHGLNSGPFAVQSISRSCQNCHTMVHGTNSPSGALLHR